MGRKVNERRSGIQDGFSSVTRSSGRKRGQVIEPHSDDPVIHPNVTIASMTDRVAALVMRKRGFLWWRLALIPTSLATLWLFVSLGYLFVDGIGIWGLNWPGTWGFAILSYVWWIAIASAGPSSPPCSIWCVPTGARRSTALPRQ